jgi:hypothetical protein
MYESGFGRLIGVLISPRKTFEAIAARPTWVAAALALVVVVATVGYLAAERMDWDDVMRGQLAQSGQEVPAEVIDRQVALMEKSGSLISLFTGVGPVVLALIAAALFLLAFRLLGSEKLDFVSSFSVVLHSCMPVVVGALLSLPVILSKTTIGFEQATRGYLMSNLAFLAGDETAPALRALLARLDFFSIWILVLLILGYRVVARVSTKAASATVILLWLILVGIAVGWTATFS